MRKFIFTILMLALGFSSYAQDGFRAGISGGIPIGDAGDFATFAIAVDLGYLFDLSDDFQAGVTTGYSHSFSEDLDGIELDDVQFIPIAASGRFAASEQFTIGADIGYALGINEGEDGGFYYSPRISYSISDAIDIVAAYRGVSRDGGSWDIISFGVEFGL